MTSFASHQFLKAIYPHPAKKGENKKNENQMVLFALAEEVITLFRLAI